MMNRLTRVKLLAPPNMTGRVNWIGLIGHLEFLLNHSIHDHTQFPISVPRRISLTIAIPMTTMMILKVLKTRTIQTSRRLMIPTMTPTNPRPNRKKPKQNPSSCFLLSFEMSVGIYPLEFQLETKVMFVAAFHVVVVVDPLGFRFV